MGLEHSVPLITTLNPKPGYRWKSAEDLYKVAAWRYVDPSLLEIVREYADTRQLLVVVGDGDGGEKGHEVRGLSIHDKQWFRLPTPNQRGRVAVVGLRGKVYMIGGFRNDSGVPTGMEVLDLSQQQKGWLTLPAPPVAQFHPQAFVWGRYIYVFNRGYREVWCFDTTKSEWCRCVHGVDGQSENRHAAAIGRTVYILCPPGRVQCYDMDTERCTSWLLSEDVFQDVIIVHFMFARSGRLFVVATFSKPFTAVILEGNPDTGQWIKTPHGTRFGCCPRSFAAWSETKEQLWFVQREWAAHPRDWGEFRQPTDGQGWNPTCCLSSSCRERQCATTAALV